MFTPFLRLLYPKLCFACAEPLFEQEAFVCTSCRIQIPRLESSPYWLRAKFDGQISYEHALAFALFNPGGLVQSLMHQVKYKGAHELGEFLGQWSAATLKKYHFDVIVPIPLHADRLRERGYNQATCIAKGLSDALGIRMDEAALVRNVGSRSLVNLVRAERLDELADVFTCMQDLNGLRVLIVDDTITTGATLLAAGQKIRAAGAIKVSFFALAALK